MQSVNHAFNLMNKFPGCLPRPPALPASGTRIVSPESTPNQFIKKEKGKKMKTKGIHKFKGEV